MQPFLTENSLARGGYGDTVPFTPEGLKTGTGNPDIALVSLVISGRDSQDLSQTAPLSRLVDRTLTVKLQFGSNETAEDPSPQRVKPAQ